MTEPHDSYSRIISAFDRSDIAQQFLSEDGEGGFAAGVSRMIDEIDRLRAELEKTMRIVGTSLHSDVATERIKLENDRLRAENERLREDLVQSSEDMGRICAARQWQPIETAPKDGGTFVLLFVGGTEAWCPTIGRWNGDGWGDEIETFHTDLNMPTHWMPLPEPPKEIEG